MVRWLLGCTLLLAAFAADAYIGPGAGIGFLGSLWAWLVGLLVVVSAILIWPLRWLWRRMRGKQVQTTSTDSKSPE